MLFDSRQGRKLITGIHEFWYRATNGVIGGNLLGAKVLLLTTTGRKSGKRFTTPLTYLDDGDNIVVIASNGGAATDPDWWRNLKGDPRALVQVGGRHKELRAEAADGAERDRLWAAITARHPIYRRYESATKRQIPIVVLRPNPPDAATAPPEPESKPEAAIDVGATGSPELGDASSSTEQASTVDGG